MEEETKTDALANEQTGEKRKESPEADPAKDGSPPKKAAAEEVVYTTAAEEAVPEEKNVESATEAAAAPEAVAAEGQ
jgi:hypothetical protein